MYEECIKEGFGELTSTLKTFLFVVENFIDAVMMVFNVVLRKENKACKKYECIYMMKRSLFHSILRKNDPKNFSLRSKVTQI